MSQTLQERARIAEAALMSHLMEFRDVYGPLCCPIHGRDEDMCECDPSTGVPFGNLMVQEFILGTAWTDMETGESFFDYAANSGQLLSHTVGLLTVISMKVEEAL